MSAICCPHCDHASADPNAWRLPATHPVDCQACGKTFSLEAGLNHAEEIDRQTAAAKAAASKNQILEEIDQPTARRPAGRTATVALETQLCRFCRSEIDADAQKCPRCQEWLDGRKQPATVAPTHTFHPGVAAILSFFIPGLGQLYKLQFVRAVFWPIMVFLGYFFFIIPGLLLHLICIVDAAASDPVRT